MPRRAFVLHDSVHAGLALLALLAVSVASCADAVDPARTNPRSLRPPTQKSVAVDPALAAAANAGLSVMAGDARQQIQWALQGRRLRRGQDDMLRIEAVVPGFAGYYVDENERVVLLRRRQSQVSDDQLRQLVYAQYASSASDVVRATMASAASANVVDAAYSLSELIAWERRVLENWKKVPKFTGTGVLTRANKVTVTVEDAAYLTSAGAAIQLLGVPAAALNFEVSGPVTTTIVRWNDRVRPTRAGIQLSIIGNPAWPYNAYVFSHGFNVRLDNAPGQPTRFLTVGHGYNQYWGVNGKTGVVVYQATEFDGSMGNPTTNPPWEVGPQCLGADFCTDNDTALGTFFSGVSGDRRVGTSVNEGLNGNPGTQEINGWYPINGVLEPDQVLSNPWGIHKSGRTSGTTTGIQAETAFNSIATVGWGAPGVTRTVFFGNFARARSVGWGLGDSGAPVFARTQACGAYCAVGIHSQGQGTWSPQTSLCTAGVNCAILYTALSTATLRLGQGPLNPRTNP